MPQTPADPLAWGAPADAVEEMGKRGLGRKVFKHADGKRTHVFGASFHYNPGNDLLEDADTQFRTVGTSKVADHLPHSVDVTGRNLTITDRATGKGIQYILPATGVTIAGDTISFNWNGSDWTYRVTWQGIKLSGVVPASRGLQHFQFPYTRVGGAAALTILPDGSVQGDGFRMPAPVVLGADEKIYSVGAWTLSANFLEFDWDDSALPAGAFPYTLDPSTTFAESTGTDDAIISGTSATWPPASGIVTDGVRIQAERYFDGANYSLAVSALRFNTASLSGSTILAAQLLLNLTTNDHPDSRSFMLEYYASSNWPIDASDWTTTQSGSANAGIAQSDFDGLLTAVVPLLSPDSNISKSGNTGFRMHLSGGSPSGGNRIWFTDFDNGGSTTGPRLVVTTAPETAAEPVADTLVGGWTTAPLWNKIDESPASDADFIQSALAPSADVAEVVLSPLDTLAASRAHVLRVRRRKDAAGGATTDLTVSLRRGAATVLGSQTLSDIDENWTQAEIPISFSGDRDDLRVRLSANAPGGGAAPFQAPTVVGQGTAQFTATSGATFTPGLPAGWAANDIHILIALRKDNTAMTALAGWTQLATLSGDNTVAQRVEVWWRRAVGGDTAPVVTFGTGTIVRGGMIVGVRGCPTGSTPFDQSSRSANAASATVTYATVTPSQDETLLLAIAGYNDDPNNWNAISTFSGNAGQASSLGTDMELGSQWKSLGAGTGGVATGALTHTVSGGSFSNAVNVGILINLVGGVTPVTRRAQVSWIELAEAAGFMFPWRRIVQVVRARPRR